MKRILSLLFVLISIYVGAQTPVIIGTGTSNTLYGPIYIFSNSSPNNHSWNLSIYDQSEIVSAGGIAADINAISWYKVDTGSYPTQDGIFEIYLKHTTLNEFSTAGNFDAEVTGATLVYSNVYQALSSITGWIEFIFNNNFSWNGTDNIMILTRWVRVGNATDEINWQATNTSPIIRLSHSFNSNSTMGTLYTSGNRPNIRLIFNSSTNISTANFALNIKVYPNPANSFITVEGDYSDQETHLSISDIAGKNVYDLVLSKEYKQRIDIQNLSNGIYFLNLISNEFAIGRKLIINKIE